MLARESALARNLAAAVEWVGQARNLFTLARLAALGTAVAEAATATTTVVAAAASGVVATAGLAVEFIGGVATLIWVVAGALAVGVFTGLASNPVPPTPGDIPERIGDPEVAEERPEPEPQLPAIQDPGASLWVPVAEPGSGPTPVSDPFDRPAGPLRAAESDDVSTSYEIFDDGRGST